MHLRVGEIERIFDGYGYKMTKMFQIAKFVFSLAVIFINFEFLIFCRPTSSTVKDLPDYPQLDTDAYYEDNFEKIAVSCPNFSTLVVNRMTDLNFSIPTETEIAQLKHVNGIKPIHYNLTINFLESGKFNFTTRTATKIQVMVPVGRLILDYNPDSLKFYDKSSFFIQFITDPDKIICFKSMTLIREDKNMIVDLNEKLHRGQYILNLGLFGGSPLKRKTGSLGFQISGSKSSYWAISSIFQMRGARTVFPCFDHPLLKATFRVCIEHSNDTTVASNSPLEKKITLNNNRLLDCFVNTLKIPVYVLSIALLNNFSNVTDTIDSPYVDLYYPTKVDWDKYYWEFDETRRVISYMENITKFNYPLSKLGLLNLHNAPFWGVENFGMVTLESGFMENSEYERGHTILVHEIIHQWLGDVVTVSDWTEICLQEGLTAYLEWTVSRKLGFVSNSVSDLAHEARSAALHRTHVNPIIQKYNATREIIDYCFGKPAVILNMIAHFYEGVWNRFLHLLIAKFQFSNANLNDWIDTLNEATGLKDPGGVLQSWFIEIGYPIFYVYINSNNNSITIRQFISLNDYNDPLQKPYVPIKATITPLRVYSKSGLSSSINDPFIIKSVNQTFQLKNITVDDWIIVDPSCVTLSRKVYEVGNYLALIDCYLRNPDLCNVNHLNDVFGDFCYALINDWLPFVPYDNNFEADQWVKLFARLFSLVNKNSTGHKKFQMDEICQCCLRSKEDFRINKSTLTKIGSLNSIWNENCKELKLINLMGRNYTLNDIE